MASGFELTDWEKRREWYGVIQLGKDVSSQNHLLKKQAAEMMAAQAASANEIIASQDRIREGIDKISYQIENGMEGLKAAFEFGISEVVWQIEQNREVLKNIVEVLLAPLDTQAKELRHRAEDAYTNGWHDDALEDFLESEKKNKYDFSVHMSIGMIYLFHKVDRDKALEYFTKAAKYAKPKSSYHTSYALLHAALIKRDYNLIEEAEQLSSEAADLSPEFAEALYQNAQYNAKLQKVSKSIQRLNSSISLDNNYCLKANTDIMFDPIRQDVDILFTNLRDTLISECKRQHESYTSSLQRISPFIQYAWVSDYYKITFDKLMTELLDIRKIIDRNSYFDGVNARERMGYFSVNANKYLENTINYFASLIKPLSKEQMLANDRAFSKTKKSKNTLQKISWVMSILIWASIVGALFYFKHPYLAVALLLAGVIGSERAEFILSSIVGDVVAVRYDPIQKRISDQIIPLENDLMKLKDIKIA